MSDDAQRWKEKYLKGIEQQEKLERRWDARLDLLRRGLVRSTLAAEGTDRAVDQCMKEMREVVRTDDMDAGLAALIPRLEKAVLDSEQRRETRVNQTSAALTALVTQLQTLTAASRRQPTTQEFCQATGCTGQSGARDSTFAQRTERPAGQGPEPVGNADGTGSAEVCCSDCSVVVRKRRRNQRPRRPLRSSPRRPPPWRKSRRRRSIRPRL